MLHSGSTGDFVVEDELRELKALVLQGFGRLEGRFERVEGRLEHVEARFEPVEGKIRDEAVETRQYVDLRFGQLQTEVGELRTEMRTEFGDVRTELGNLRTEVGGLQADVAGLQTTDVSSLRTEMVRQRQLIGTEFAKATAHADRLYGKLRDQIALQSKRVTRIERRDRRRR